MLDPVVTKPSSSGFLEPREPELSQSRPNLDVRIVLVGILGGELVVAFRNALPDVHLPVGFPGTKEPLDSAARRILRRETGLEERYLEQLYTFSVDTRLGWSVIVSYLGLIGAEEPGSQRMGGKWYAANAIPPLSDADRMVVDYALLRLRAKLGYTTIAFHLLPPTFTLSDLQGVYEMVLGQSLDKRNFRRRVIASTMLSPTNIMRREGSHRPAMLYRFRAAHDRDTYLTPSWSSGLDRSSEGDIDPVIDLSQSGS